RALQAQTDRTVSWNAERVASIVLCKIFEWVKGPLIIHSFKDRIENSFAATASGKGAHLSDTASDFYKEPLDHVGGPDASPMLFRTSKESQEFLNVLRQALDGFGSASLPTLLPFSETLQSFSAVFGLIDKFGLLQAGPLGSFEFVLQVAQLVRPAALVG